ncbi:MAG: hypothetical protein FWE20_02465 [Defluviitaleaceae bacterium]|nr:hypothetical protein [Defluviitaleaceae bacterium]
MNTLGRNQRELHFEREINPASMPQQADDILVMQMVAETMSAKRAWIMQLDMMMQRDERDDVRETLRLIRLDELKHVRLLSQLPMSAESGGDDGQRPEGVISYNRAAKLKLKSSEFVRKIYYSFFDTPTRDMLFEIVCDDTNNAVRFSLLAGE